MNFPRFSEGASRQNSEQAALQPKCRDRPNIDIQSSVTTDNQFMGIIAANATQLVVFYAIIVANLHSLTYTRKAPFSHTVNRLEADVTLHYVISESGAVHNS